MQRHLELPFLIIIGFLLTCFLTWPLITKINSYYGDDSDYGLVGWMLWYNQNSIITGRIFDQQSYFNSNQFFPLPLSFAYSEQLFVPSLIFAPIYWLSKDLVFSVNYYDLLTFVFTFLSSFYCLNFFVKNKYASLVGAFVFTFNPLTFAHSYGHLQLMNKFFLPPMFLFAYLYIKNPAWKNSLLFFLFFTLNALSSIYFQVFSIVFIPIFWLPFLAMQLIRKNVNFFLKFFLTGLIFLVFLPILLYFNLPYLQLSSKEGVVRTTEENAYFSARGIDWVSSLNNNLLYGKLVKSLDFLRQPREGNGSFNYSEHTLSLNLIAIILFLTGFFSVRKRTSLFPFVLVLFLSAVFTFGPYFNGWNEKSSTRTVFYYNLYQVSDILRGIRVPSRFQFIFYLPFSLFVAFGAKRLLKLDRRVSVVLFGLIWLFLMLENINTVNFDSTSPILEYINLKKSEKSLLTGLLAEKNTVHLPLYIEGGFRNVGYLNWSTITGEKIFNGYSGYAPAEWFRIAEQVRTLDKKALEKFFVLGIDYLVIHKDLIEREDTGVYRNNINFLQQGVVYNDQKIELVDLKKLKLKITFCSSRDVRFVMQSKTYPVTQASGTTFQLFSKIFLINPKNCYLVSKYYDRYSQVDILIGNKKQSLPVRLPLLVEPFEKVQLN